MKKYDWKNEYNPIRRTAKRLLSGEALTDGRPLSDLIELDEHTRKCLAFEATLTDRQIDMLQELGYLPVIMRQYGEECANCPYTLDEREHGISSCFRRNSFFLLPFRLFMVRTLRSSILEIHLVNQLFNRIPIKVSREEIIHSGQALILSISDPEIPHLFIASVYHQLVKAIQFEFV